MKKAVIVTAVVKTRIIVDDSMTEEQIIVQAKERLESNLHNDYYDLIDKIEDDTECPYDEETDVVPMGRYNTYFKVNGVDVISRGDYESLPSALCTYYITDNEMQQIAKEIYDNMVVAHGKVEAEAYMNGNDNEIVKSNYDTIANDFWEIMEKIGLNYGMVYYDDMTIEEYYRIKNMLWENN